MKVGFAGLGAFLACVVVPLGMATANETITYTYDELGRLVAVSAAGTVNNGQNVSTAFDPAGNRTNYSVSGVTAPAPMLAIGGASVTEGGALQFTVTRSGNVTGAVSASYATAGGTATSGGDFTAATGTVSFAANQTSATISVGTIDDAVVESAEAMTVTLSAPTGGASITTAVGTGTINDNDAAAANLAIGNASATEGGALSFTVTRSGNTATAVGASYATAGGTATSGSDFTASSGTVSFVASQTTATINVSTTDDAVVESAEAMAVTLSSPTGGATITAPSGTGNINDNDGATAPSFSIADASTTEGGSLTFSVTKTGAATSSFSVSYATATGTAGTNDFYATSGTLNFAANETVKLFDVISKTDIVIEAEEDFYVNLSNPSGGSTISIGQAIGTIFDICGNFLNSPETSSSSEQIAAAPSC